MNEKILICVLIVVGALWLYTITMLIDERNAIADKHEFKMHVMEESYERCLERYHILEDWLRGYYAKED